MLAGTCVLCVDDESAIRLTIKLILEQAGYDVFGAADVHDAMRLLSGVAVDLVLLDCGPGKEWLIDKVRHADPSYPRYSVYRRIGT